MGTAYLEPESEEQQLVAKQLGEENATIDDATELVNDPQLRRESMLVRGGSAPPLPELPEDVECSGLPRHR